MPSEWQSASAGKGRTNILCVCAEAKILSVSGSAEGVIFYVILHLKGD